MSLIIELLLSWTIFTSVVWILYWGQPTAGRFLGATALITILKIICLKLSKLLVKLWASRRVVDPSRRLVVIMRCDAGYGHRLAIELDALGYHVIACCKVPESEGPQALIKVCSERLRVVAVDTDEGRDVRALCEDVTKTCGESNVELWAVVVILGVVTLGELEWYDEDDIRWMFEVNVIQICNVIRHFMPLLRNSTLTNKRVVVVNNIWAKLNVPTAGPFCMTKHALRSYINTLSQEIKKFGIIIIHVEPNVYQLPVPDVAVVLTTIRALWQKQSQTVKEAYKEGYVQRVEAAARILTVPGAHPNAHLVVRDLMDAVVRFQPTTHYISDHPTRKLLYYILWISPTQLMNYYGSEAGTLLRL